MISRQSFFLQFSIATIAWFVATTPIATHAQNLFLTTGSYTANDNTYANNGIYVGQDPSFTSTDANNNPYVAALSVVNGASVRTIESFNTSTVSIVGGNVTEANAYDSSTITVSATSNELQSLQGYDTATVIIRGGQIKTAIANDASRIDVVGGGVSNTVSSEFGGVTIMGGTVTNAFNFEGGTTVISGGTVTNAESGRGGVLTITGGTVTTITMLRDGMTSISGGNVFETIVQGGVLNISGGTTNRVNSNSNSTVNVTGGEIVNGMFLPRAAVANFFGTDFSFVHNGYGDINNFGELADFFTVTGTLSGIPRTYDIYVRNLSGTANTAQRQFNFVVVPEAGTLALLLPALFGTCAVISVRRHKKTGSAVRATRSF